MYDATGVRLHAGKQASILNMIITELPPDHPVSANGSPLKDSLGHTPLQVGRLCLLPGPVQPAAGTCGAEGVEKGRHAALCRLRGWGPLG